jgi:protein-tyrosine-phosphatase
MNSPCNVLFLCTGNSARSILAEVLVNRLGGGAFRGFSAGSQPKGAVHPKAIELLKSEGFTTDTLRSKSWDEFALPDAPVMDFVLTVCDNAAGETCPYWPGHPITAHWGLPDPAAVEGSDAAKYAAFRSTYAALGERIRRLTRLPVAATDRATLQKQLAAIGDTDVDKP